MGKESLYAYTNVGTPYYMSPEQISEEKYDEKSDIWSTGCILYEIASLKPPFEATTQVALAVKIKDGKYNRLPKIYSEELWRVITLMLAPEKEKRPSVDDLLNIPQISLRLREKRIRDSFAKLKKREEEMKTKELKIVELESQLIKQQKELEEKAKEIEDKNEQLKQKECELEMLRKQLELQNENNLAPIISDTPVMANKSHNYTKIESVNVSEHTPIPAYQRGYQYNKYSEVNQSEHVSIYDSLKQEIKSLSSQIGTGSSN